MSQETPAQNPMSADYLQQCLVRLRKRLTYAQDEMDITSYAIRGIENDLANIQKEDGVANETHEKTE